MKSHTKHFKRGDTVEIVNVALGDEKYLNKTGKIIGKTKVGGFFIVELFDGGQFFAVPLNLRTVKNPA